MVNLVFYTRRRDLKRFSIEFLFDTIAKYLPSDYSARFEENTVAGKNALSRLLSIIYAPFKQGDINHVTGDVHYIVILLRQSKTILTIHDLEFYKRAVGLRKVILYILWIWLPVKRCKYITVVSQSTKRELLKVVEIDPADVYVVPNFVDPRFHAQEKSFNSKCPRILQVGTKKNKNIPRLIDALRDLNCVLVIVGILDRDLANRLSSCKFKLEHYSELSFEELRTEYVKSDIVTVVSTEEGFGLPIIEAQVVGRVVVASNLSALPEIAGEGACYVDPFSTDDIRKGIREIIGNRLYRNRLIREGYANCQRFSVEKTVAKYVSIYRKIHEEKVI